MSDSTFNGHLLTGVATSTPPSTWSNASMLAQSVQSSKGPDRSLVGAVASINKIQDSDFRFVIKAALLSLAILAELWLVSDFANNFVMIFGVIALLWAVFGGHASLCVVNRAPSAPKISPHITKDIKPWLADVISPPLIEVIEVVDFPIEIVAVVDSFEMEEADYIPDCPNTLTAVLDDTEYGQDDLTWTDRIYDAVHHVCIFEDYQDALTWMSRVADAVHHVCVYEVTTPNSTGGSVVSEETEGDPPYNEEKKVALVIRNEIRAQANVFQGLPVSHVPIDIEQALAYLVNEHENPTFHDGDIATAKAWMRFHNHKPEGGKIFHDMNASVASECDWDLCTDGHSVFGDARDMSFMLNDLEDELPVGFFQEFNQSPFESRYRGRDRVTNASFWHYRLTEQWYVIKTANTPRAVRNHGDVVTAEHARVKRSTPACPDIERGIDGPYSRSRSYLTETEEYIINIGIAEYNQYCDYENPKLSQLQKNLEARAKDTQSPNQNHVLTWLFSMDECQQLDPNAFDTCECGVKAFVELDVYREELEHGLIPASFFLHEFPISYVPQEIMSARRELKEKGEETTDDDCIPRCQKILQGCELHEMACNNIFVLIDTSVDDINNRISDPEGLLPAPGQMVSTKFPPGYHTQPRFLTIPYDTLTKRCEHGHPEDLLFGSSCHICFPKYQAELRRNEVLMDRSQDNHVDSHGVHGFRNVPPLFSLYPPGFLNN